MSFALTSGMSDSSGRGFWVAVGPPDRESLVALGPPDNPAHTPVMATATEAATSPAVAVLPIFLRLIRRSIWFVRAVLTGLGPSAFVCSRSLSSSVFTRSLQEAAGSHRHGAGREP